MSHRIDRYGPSLLDNLVLFIIFFSRFHVTFPVPLIFGTIFFRIKERTTWEPKGVNIEQRNQRIYCAIETDFGCPFRYHTYSYGIS